MNDSTITETWLPVVGYEGFYEVSDIGGVRSVDRFIGGRNGSVVLRRGVTLSQFTTKDGRQIVFLSRDGKKSAVRAHRLVLMAFVGPCTDGMVCCHWDGDPQNNRVENLRWDTPRNNSADSARHGTMPLGEQVHSSKLTEANVRNIRSSAETRNQLADRFDVSASLISMVRLRRLWKHVK